ncbi:MAG: hypothetical protein AAFN10_09535 [Bacteroidota bacterium]
MKIARILFLIVSTMFIGIGALHLAVHFTVLHSADYQAALAPIDHLSLNGQQANIWLLWQGFSMMMGVGLICIGLLNFGYLLGNTPLLNPPNAVIGIMFLFLAVVILSGFLYFSMAQVIGGALGICLLVITAIYKPK